MGTSSEILFDPNVENLFKKVHQNLPVFDIKVKPRPTKKRLNDCYQQCCTLFKLLNTIVGGGGGGSWIRK